MRGVESNEAEQVTGMTPDSKTVEGSGLAKTARRHALQLQYLARGRPVLILSGWVRVGGTTAVESQRENMLETEI